MILNAMLRISAGVLALVVSSFPSHVLAHDSRSDKPNIVILFADDLGYADLGCQGLKEVKSPHIDSIADNGARLTAGYVTAPQCCPSRAGLLPGRCQNRFGFEDNNSNKAIGGLPLSEKTIADYIGSKYVSVVSNGTVSIMIALMALNIKGNDEVIVPDYTMIASANAVVIAGAQPVLVDINHSDMYKALYKTFKSIFLGLAYRAYLWRILSST